MKEKIKAEIERLRKNLPWGGSAAQLSFECNCKNEAYTEIEKFVNSLPEEPVSDNLEKAAVEAFKQIVDSDKNNFLEVFKAGAKWQKEKSDKAMDIADIAYFKSCEKIRQQIINKALEWLKFNLQDYAGFDDKRNQVPFDKDVFEDFRKAMEE